MLKHIFIGFLFLAVAPLWAQQTITHNTLSSTVHTLFKQARAESQQQLLQRELSSVLHQETHFNQKTPTRVQPDAFKVADALTSTAKHPSFLNSYSLEKSLKTSLANSASQISASPVHHPWQLAILLGSDSSQRLTQVLSALRTQITNRTLYQAAVLFNEDSVTKTDQLYFLYLLLFLLFQHIFLFLFLPYSFPNSPQY